jgi:uncharacterized membrane protein YjgN (DUF898 family)
MNHDQSEPLSDRGGASPFTFTGEWREFLPIALTNLALTIVTLGIYRFWAKARERRYLWSRTHFLDDTLEWTGTGKEMFLGFLVVMAVLLPLLLFFNFGLEALLLRGMFAEAAIGTAIVYAIGLYLYHVARFRALRYRLSRSYWHGIRGGSDGAGWDYGWSGLWKTVVGMFPIGLLMPWTMTRLWNERWNAMSFGPYPFEAQASPDGLFGRWLLIYLTPLILIPVMLAFGIVAAFGGGDQSEAGMLFGVVAALVLVYLVFLLISLSFYALLYRHVVAATSIASVRFQFNAHTRDWLRLILGNIALVIVTLGFGLMFIAYRNWAFVVEHMEASGTIDFALLTQSQTRAQSDAEGLADAFDIGGV